MTNVKGLFFPLAKIVGVIDVIRNLARQKLFCPKEDVGSSSLSSPSINAFKKIGN